MIDLVLSKARLLPALLILTALIAGMSACDTPLAPRYPEITFTHKPPIRMVVSEIRIVDAYEPPLKLPNVEHEFPVTPAEAAKRWARDRLVANGADGVATFTVKEASAVEVPLERTGGITGLFKTDQSERYDAVLEVELEVQNARGGRGFVQTRAMRGITVPEDATLNERERVYFEVTEKLLKDFDAEMEKNIDQFLPKFVER